MLDIKRAGFRWLLFCMAGSCMNATFAQQNVFKVFLVGDAGENADQRKSQQCSHLYGR